MLFFGPIRSLFDFGTFAIMLWAFHAGPPLFRSGWFVESLATQTFVVLVIRTRRIPFWRSRPSRALLIAVVAVAGPVGRLAYEDAGGGPAVVLVHGGLADRSHFAHISAHLATRQRVIAIDLRGHGDSDMPDDEFTVADLAADIAAVCDQTGVDRAVICGHSLSGAVALELAATRPELVSAVAILDGALLYPEAVLKALRGQLVPALDGPGWRGALRGLVTSRMLTAYDPPELRERVLRAVDEAPKQVAVPWFRNAYTWDASERVAAFAQPLLFVHATSPADLARLQQLRPDALLGRVVGSGHFLTLAVPEQVNAMLDRFLEICAAS